MDINQFKTLTGLTLAEAAVKLDEQLTNIDDPNWMREVLNTIFGVCGLGWGYEYDPANMQTGSQQGTRTVSTAFLKHLRFWYKVVDDNGNIQVCSVDASGASENSNTSYAMNGAIINALGNAVGRKRSF